MSSRLTNPKNKRIRVIAQTIMACIILSAWILGFLPGNNGFLTITIVLAAAFVLFGDAVKKAREMATTVSADDEEDNTDDPDDSA